MNLLCFDVAGPVGSIAVFKENECIAYLENPEKRTHAAKLVPLIEDLLRDSGLTYVELDAIVTSVGPGSFTGIRVGLATAKGLEIATKKPVLGLNSFELCHWKCRSLHKDSLPILVTVDALRDDVYCQLFDESGKAEDSLNITPAELADYMKGKRFILSGSGIAQVKPALDEAGLDFTSCEEPYTARDLGEMVLSFSEEQVRDLSDRSLEPFYLRAPDIGKKS